MYRLKIINTSIHVFLTSENSSYKICKNNPFVYDTSRANFYLAIISGIIPLNVSSHSPSIKSIFSPRALKAFKAVSRIYRLKDLIFKAK